MEIFLSRPTWVAPEYEPGLTTLLTQLDNLDLKPRTLGVSDYPSKAPLDEVIEIMGSCKGAVILGYPQLEIYSGVLKENEITSTICLGTEWNHLEAGIAYATGLPLLVIHHSNVSRGIFDRGVLNAYIHSVDLTVPNWSMQQPLSGAINRWKQACVDGSSNFQNAQKQIPTQTKNPICPNCSTNNKKIYMRNIPSELVNIAGGSWECAQCKFVTK